MNWSNANFSSNVTVQYFFDIPPFNIPATTSTTQIVSVGILTNPTIINAPSSWCTTNTSNFTVSTTNSIPAGANTYWWTVTSGNSIIGSNTGSSITVSHGTGPITISLKFKNTLCNTYSSSTSKTVSRISDAPPIPSVFFQRIGSSCMYEAVANAANASSYIWSSNSSFTNSLTGVNTITLGECYGTCTYSIYCKAQNGCGVSAYKYKFQTVTPPSNCMAIVQNPNDDITNKGSENFEMKSLNSYEIIQSNEFRIFPNPTQNSFTITTPQMNQSFNIDVLNYNGQLVLTKRIFSNEKTINIDVSNLSNGLYFVKAVSEDGFSVNHMSRLEIVR